MFFGYSFDIYGVFFCVEIFCFVNNVYDFFSYVLKVLKVCLNVFIRWEKLGYFYLIEEVEVDIGFDD